MSAPPGPARRAAGRAAGPDVVTEVAWAYYQEGRTQRDIAEGLGVSRASVVNYLAEARARGLVRITLDPDAFTGLAVARALRDAFGLAAAYVVPDAGEAEATFARVARGAADWLPSLLEPGDRLGLAWGRTMFEMAGMVEDRTIPDLTVLQLVGSMATPYGFAAEACSTRLAGRLGARCVNLHAPAILSRAALAAELRREPVLRDQLAQVARCGKTIFSVGTVAPDSHIVRSGLATPADLEHYVSEGAAGVICGRFVGRDGRAIAGPMDGRMIGVDLERLTRIEAGIMVTPGSDKVGASLAAIRGGFVTHVVTSDAIAREMLGAVDGEGPRPSPASAAGAGRP